MRTTWSDGLLRYTYATLADIELFAGMLAKESVCEHVFFGPNTPAETHAFFTPIVGPMQEALGRGERPASHVLTLRRAADGRFAGQCAVVVQSYSRDHYEIGYQLDEPFWRQGLGTRAAEFLVHLGLRELGADRLGAECLASNRGSARILEKCGFRLEGRRRRCYHVRGRHHDQLLFGLLREEATLDLDGIGARLTAT